MKSIDDIISRSGGVVTVETWPAALPIEYWEEIMGTLEFLNSYYEIICERYGSSAKVMVALIHSPAFSCKVSRIDQDQYLILIPLGVAARVSMLSRILLPYIEKGKNFLMISSLRDNIQIPDECIPQLLHPVFLDNPVYENYWPALNELGKKIKTGALDPEVLDILRISHIFLVSHELTHILHGHFDLIERSKSYDTGLSKEMLMRGLEIDADDGATALSMLLLQQTGDQDVAHFKLSYTVTMLFGIYDVQRRRFADYNNGIYNHPVVRCDIFQHAAENCLDAPPRIKKRIINTIVDGWEKCVFSFSNLHLDALKGRFGKFPKNRDRQPFYALLYARTEIYVVQEMLEDALKLMHQVRGLLPLFKKSK